MLETFVVMTQKKDFKILPCAYGDNFGGNDIYRYALSVMNDESVRMDVPINLQNTLANTVNGFQYQNVGYGQFTGVMAYRPKELYYFTFDNS